MAVIEEESSRTACAVLIVGVFFKRNRRRRNHKTKGEVARNLRWNFLFHRFTARSRRPCVGRFLL